MAAAAAATAAADAAGAAVGEGSDADDGASSAAAAQGRWRRGVPAGAPASDAASSVGGVTDRRTAQTAARPPRVVCARGRQRGPYGPSPSCAHRVGLWVDASLADVANRVKGLALLACALPLMHAVPAVAKPTTPQFPCFGALLSAFVPFTRFPPSLSFFVHARRCLCVRWDALLVFLSGSFRPTLACGFCVGDLSGRGWEWVRWR